MDDGQLGDGLAGDLQIGETQPQCEWRLVDGSIVQIDRADDPVAVGNVLPPCSAVVHLDVGDGRDRELLAIQTLDAEEGVGLSHGLAFEELEQPSGADVEVARVSAGPRPVHDLPIEQLAAAELPICRAPVEDADVCNHGAHELETLDRNPWRRAPVRSL